MARSGRYLITLALLFVITSCSSAPATSTPVLLPSPTASVVPVSPTPMPSNTPAPMLTRPPAPTATPEPEDTGWRTLASGVEWRRLWADTGAGRERLQMVRFEPGLVRLRVLYQPSHPRRISQWATTLPDALLIVNAGYFTPENRAAGLIISNGMPWGRPYDDYAGMLAVSANGQITLRWLRTWPYRPDEKLAQAVQSFPVLVKPGGQMGFPSDADEGQRSRRTVVAQDTTGRIILLVSPDFRFSLHELAVWLTESDLDLDIAMNLDGGTSTGLWINGHEYIIESPVAVPAVIVVEPLDG